MPFTQTNDEDKGGDNKPPKSFDGICTGKCDIKGFLIEYCVTCGWEDGWFGDLFEGAFDK